MAKPVERRVREEDVLECYLFPKFCYNSNFSDSVTEDLLLQEIVKYNKEIQAYTKDYIWHRDFLAFRPKTKQAILLEQFHDRVITPEGKSKRATTSPGVVILYIVISVFDFVEITTLEL